MSSKWAIYQGSHNKIALLLKGKDKVLGWKVWDTEWSSSEAEAQHAVADDPQEVWNSDKLAEVERLQNTLPPVRVLLLQ